MQTSCHILQVLLLVVIIVIVEGLAQGCIKKYDNGESMLWFFTGALLYMLIVLVLSRALKKEKMAIVNILWGAISAILISIFAYVAFQEKLNKYQILGIVITLVGIALIYKHDA